MKDQECENNLNQNIDQLEPKPQSPNRIKEPEKLMNEGNSLQNKKDNNKINNKYIESRMINDDVEHPEPLLSDYYEETTEEIKKNFYENKKKENIIIIEKKKNLRANNAQIMEQKLKAEYDSIQLKENIGKVVLNSKFMNEKDLKKNKSQKCNLIIKPEQVVNNFMLERTSNINKLNDFEIINGNKNNKIIKKNNSYQVIQSHKNAKLIKNNNKNLSQQQARSIAKIPINLNMKNKQIIKQINKIPQPMPQLKMNNQQKMGNIQYNSNKLIKQASSKSGMNKIPMKKIIKITPITNIPTLENEKNRSPKMTLKKIEPNYIQKIQYQNDIINQSNNNSILNKIVIRNNCNTLNKSISRNSNKINLSFENPMNIVKMISPAKLENSIRRSNEIFLSNQQKDEIKRIPIPFKVNNKDNNMQYYTISKDNNNFSNRKTEVNISNDFKMNSIYKVNDSFLDSDKENYSSNFKYDKCNKKTIERGGQFNNVSTTFVVIKNSNTKLKYPEPSLTIDTQNFTKTKVLIPNSSTISVQHSPVNSHLQQNSILSQKENQTKAVKMFKSQNNLLKGKKNNSFSYQNNYTNYSLYGRNDANIINTKNFYDVRNKALKRPVIYKYNYGNNLWPDESYFSYFNTNGYNY